MADPGGALRFRWRVLGIRLVRSADRDDRGSVIGVAVVLPRLSRRSGHPTLSLLFCRAEVVVDPPRREVLTRPED